MSLLSLLIVLCVPLLISLFVKKLRWWGDTQTAAGGYTDAEMQALLTSPYPSWYKLFIIIPVLELGIPLALGVLFAGTALNTAWLAEIMRSWLAPDALFFNPSPAIVAIAIGGFAIITFGGFALAASLNTLLPSNVAAYLTKIMGKRRYARIKPQAEADAVIKLAVGVYIFVIILISAALPFHVFVDAAGVHHPSTYPKHEQLSLEDMQKLTVSCEVVPTKEAPELQVTIRAQFHQKEVTLLEGTDGQLPAPYTSVHDIQSLYGALSEHRTTIVKLSNADCAALAERNPKMQAQYSAFFR